MNLDSQFTIRNVLFPGRFFFAPINTGFAKNGIPDDRLTEFHRSRSGSRIAVSYVGNVAIGESYLNSNATGYLQSSTKWAEIAEAINSNNSIAAIQLAAQKQTSPSSLKWVNSNLADFVAREREFLGAIPASELNTLINLYRDSVILAHSYGFRLIQIHAAHGYLISRLLNKHLNVRSDEYSDGTLILERVANEIRSAVPSVIVDLRLSITDGIDCFENEIASTKERIRRLSNSGIDMISLSNGMYDVNRHLIYPKLSSGHGVYIDQAAEFADEFSNLYWNVAGNITNLAKLPATPDNLTFSIGRALIADPRFVELSLSGDAEEIVNCLRCGHCHYFSRQRPNIECGVNLDLASSFKR